jgi:hypothetical protein
MLALCQKAVEFRDTDSRKLPCVSTLEGQEEMLEARGRVVSATVFDCALTPIGYRPS